MENWQSREIFMWIVFVCSELSRLSIHLGALSYGVRPMCNTWSTSCNSTQSLPDRRIFFSNSGCSSIEKCFPLRIESDKSFHLGSCARGFPSREDFSARKCQRWFVAKTIKFVLTSCFVSSLLTVNLWRSKHMRASISHLDVRASI